MRKLWGIYSLQINLNNIKSSNITARYGDEILNEVHASSAVGFLISLALKYNNIADIADAITK